jgi:hypothetical protein
MTTEPRRIYISGPMTGRPDLNFPAFHAAADRFRKAGWDVANPALNFGGRTDLPREMYLRADVTMLAGCDAIALLPGWLDSCGASLEYLLALRLGLEVFDAETLEPLHGPPHADISLWWDPPPESVLDTAKRITSADRQTDYGHPRDDFARTAALWTAILSGRLRDGQALTAMDIPLCMIALKLARQVHRHKRDNLVDIAGYARTAAMVAGDE